MLTEGEVWLPAVAGMSGRWAASPSPSRDIRVTSQFAVAGHPSEGLTGGAVYGHLSDLLSQLCHVAQQVHVEYSRVPD